MMDMVTVSTVLALDDQENTAQEKSAGKRSRESYHTYVGSSSKRRALASLSNHVDAITERHQRNSKVSQCLQTALPPSSVFDFPCSHTQITSGYVTSSMSHLTTPGELASPMLLSSPPTLACSETIDIEDIEEDGYACCAEYSRDIFTYLKEAEIRCQPKLGYMLKQPDITSSMRSVLVDWLVEVVDEFSLQLRTLYLAVSLIDRFLSCMSILRGKLQLVGSTAMYIAAKVEEIYPPEISDFAYITDNTYTRQQIVRMEQLMLQALDYHLLAPSSACFLQCYLMAGKAHTELSSGDSDLITHLAQYLCELALVHSDPFLKYLPSEVAASSVCLARHCLKHPAWPPTLQSCAGYTVGDIGHCLQDMHRMFAMASQHPQQAVRLKYCSEKFMKVATIAVPETLPV